VDSLRSAAVRAGIHVGQNDQFEDLFFRVLLERVEPKLGVERPAYLLDYPSSMAALARLKPDGRYAERFELYGRGIELANGFTELTDAVEQRGRLVQERSTRKAAGKPVYALDEAFLAALSKMPPCAGVAVGLDRVLMLLMGANSIQDVLLFPAPEFGC
jgi:lysyl-tRNA synthetase class 2